MTAAPFTPEQAAKLAAFDAAPELTEASPIVRAMLALAEELDDVGDMNDETARASRVGSAHSVRHFGLRDANNDAAARIRATVATVLAADPEPRDAVIERMARAIYVADPPVDPTLPFEQMVDREQAYFRRLAASALDASRGGAQ